jgi:putative PIN family toxin of toxin-antitoxin system
MKSKPIVLDTNIIVSASLDKAGSSNASKILDAVLNGDIEIVLNEEIISEYREVLLRPQFKLDKEAVNTLIRDLEHISIDYTPLRSTKPMPDPDDRIFIDTANQAGAILITGNIKHYPKEDNVT